MYPKTLWNADHCQPMRLQPGLVDRPCQVAPFLRWKAIAARMSLRASIAGS